MKKNVLLSLKGLQMQGDIEDRDEIETITPAEYFFKNGKHYVVYEEILEGFDVPVKNVMKFYDDTLEVSKKGAISVNMLFESNRKNVTSYQTPFGTIMLGVDTDTVEIIEEEERILVHVDYVLEANYQHIADCRIEMEIREKKEGLKLFQ